jgi:predicted secreted hydrolase
MHRRELMIALALAGSAGMAARAKALVPVAGLTFPADFGAHPASRTEWWYVTGSLQAASALWGFQVTFFRSTTGVTAERNASRFAASELVFAHAALTDLEQRRLRHDQRIARSGFGIAGASTSDTDVALRDWHLTRNSVAVQSRYHASVQSDSAGFALDLTIEGTQPVLLQGIGGLSQKGPRAEQTSRYYSEPQLAVHGRLTLDGKPIEVTGKAWLDHEWSDAFLDPQAVGWDWIGMNLDDGSALTAFRLRRADGSTLYAGGSFRRSGEAVRNFSTDAVLFKPGRVWHSAASRAAYPVEWTVDTPAGAFGVKALLDDQELDSRGSTGSIYWEGLSDLVDAGGRRIGRGYLEMTGYAGALKL